MSRMSRRPWAANIDMYRKIPSDLMEGTRRGSVLSYAAIGVMVVLFIMETKAFFEKRCVFDPMLPFLEIYIIELFANKPSYLES